MRKFLFVILGCLFISSTFAAGAFIPKQGVDYTVIPNAPAIKPGAKVNVKEFFAFTCIHCKDLEPFMQKFISAHKNVQVEKIYAVWSDDKVMQNLAKLNATLVLMNLNNLYIPVFNALFAQQNLTDPAILKSFLAKNGLNSKQIDSFMVTYNSFDVSATVGKYKTMTLDPKYNVTGTPTIVVADKYIVSPALPEKLIQVTDALVDQVSKGK